MLWCSVDTRASLWRHCTHSLPSGGSCAHEHDTFTVTSPCYRPLQTAERFLLLLSRFCFILEETMLQLKEVSFLQMFMCQPDDFPVVEAPNPGAPFEAAFSFRTHRCLQTHKERRAAPKRCNSEDNTNNTTVMCPHRVGLGCCWFLMEIFST